MLTSEPLACFWRIAEQNDWGQYKAFRGTVNSYVTGDAYPSRPKTHTYTHTKTKTKNTVSKVHCVEGMGMVLMICLVNVNSGNKEKVHRLMSV